MDQTSCSFVTDLAKEEVKKEHLWTDVPRSMLFTLQGRAHSIFRFAYHILSITLHVNSTAEQIPSLKL